MSPHLHEVARRYVHDPGVKSLEVQFAALRYLTDVNTLEGK